MSAFNLQKIAYDRKCPREKLPKQESNPKGQASKPRLEQAIKPPKNKLEMKTNDIGLEIKESKTLVKMLNELLANYQIYYQNLRNFHWNVTGPNFFELHAKFEELYTVANVNVDSVAERILTLGARPLSSYAEYIENSKIKEAKEVKEAKKMVEIIRENLNELLTLERKVLESANEHLDEGTASLMSDYITEKEKVVWMLSAYLR